jgi:hypothetical protein
MATLQCLLCDTRFDRPANHFCAQECRPSAGRHVDFCRHCRTACLKALSPDLEPEIAESPVREGRDNRLNG